MNHAARSYTPALLKMALFIAALFGFTSFEQNPKVYSPIPAATILLILCQAGLFI